MKKRPLTTMETHVVRGMSFVGLLFIALNLVRLVQGQPLSSNVSQINSAAQRQRHKDCGKSSRHCATPADYIATTKSQRHE